MLLPVLALLAITLSFAAKAEAKKGETLAGVVNINSASASELAMLPGIGPSKAQAIVDYRATSKFTTTDELKKIKGIGEKLFDKIQSNVTVDGPTTAKVVRDASAEMRTPTGGGGQG